MATVQEWQRQGSHFYRVEGDFVRWSLHGPLSLDDLKMMFEVWARVAHEQGTCMTILDIKEGVSLTAEGRHYIGKRTKTVPLVGSTAILGASFMIRTIIQLIQNASRLLGRVLAPVRFCSTIEEAEAWLAKERVALLQAQSRSRS